MWTRRAYFAMIKVLSQTFSPPANAAVWAMVDFLFAVVVPQLADITIIACSLCFTLLAHVACFLGRATEHTQHVLSHLSVQIMVLDCIVTMPTCVPAATLEALHFDVAFVMLATQDKLAFGDVLFVLIAMVSVVLLRSIGWIGVAFAQIVRNIRVGVGGGRVRR